MQCNKFCTFPEVAIVRCSTKYLVLNYATKFRAEFLEMLDAAIFFRGFPMLMTSSLRHFLL